MKEIVNRRPSIWIVITIITMIVGVAYTIDHLCYEKEQDLTLQLAGSSMVYAEEVIKNRGGVQKKDGALFLGDLLLNQDTSIVDQIKERTGFGCTIFLDSIRISTTANTKNSHSRATGTYANSNIVEQVYKNGGTFSGITHTIGKDWVIIYRPLQNQKQGTLGMIATYIDLEVFADSRFHFRLFASLISILLVVSIISYSIWNRYLHRNNEYRAIKTIRSRNQELEKVNRSLDSFVYRASHDLKAPIINMQSMLTMLPSVLKVEKESTADQVIKNLNKSSQDLQNIINDLLEISRIDRKPEEKELEIELKVLVDDLIWNMSSLIQENKGQVILDFSECPKIVAPPTVLRSVLTNLINNAFKYISADRDPIVTVSSFMKEHKRCISVSDNGIGMDLNKHGKKLFKMFSRLHPYLDIEGSGIGLHMVKKMLDPIEAEIEVESTIGQGTKFIITFKS